MMNPHRETLIILIGPKGSGKTYVGTLLEARCSLRFIPVEKLWMDYYGRCAEEGAIPSIKGALTHVRSAVASAVSRDGAAVIETTGASTELVEFIQEMARRYVTYLCRVTAPLETCLERIRRRDQRLHLPVDDHTIRAIYEISMDLNLAFDLELQTDTMTDERIIASFELLLGHRCS